MAIDLGGLGSYIVHSWPQVHGTWLVASKCFLCAAAIPRDPGGQVLGYVPWFACQLAQPTELSFTGWARHATLSYSHAAVANGWQPTRPASLPASQPANPSIHTRGKLCFPLSKLIVPGILCDEIRYNAMRFLAPPSADSVLQNCGKGQDLLKRQIAGKKAGLSTHQPAMTSRLVSCQIPQLPSTTVQVLFSWYLVCTIRILCSPTGVPPKALHEHCHTQKPYYYVCTNVLQEHKPIYSIQRQERAGFKRLSTLASGRPDWILLV